MNADFSLHVSVARPYDYAAVRRLCRRAVGPDDYVLWVLREVIIKSELFLAWYRDQLVGMTRFEKCIDGSGWLSMARTDPDWQRKGVARFLQRELARRARNSGIGILRLWTLSTNPAAISACEKGGFHRICEAVHVSHSFRFKQHVRGRNSSSGRSFKSTRSIHTSSYLSKTRGYLGYKRHFVRASDTLIERISGRRELCFEDASTFILTKPEKSFGRQSCSFTLLEGDPTSSMRLILRKAKDMRVEWIGGFLPYDAHLMRVAKNTFKVDSWGNHCIVFEKII
ncbi:MAG TPA: GNAT family N-acetyltransferase [Candidatus Saccharimonadales bacterium]|nr:GNAT family N-acetyltransferase [Candidatus Saccharimonadales bacterium]